MPSIIDSLFLELGVDVSKFNADQQRALAKIAEFEKRSKKGAKGASEAVKTVGRAFRDLTDDSAIGASTRRLDTMAVKLKALGQSAQVSGGVGTGLGKMAEGLGALLSPAALGTAALGMLGVAAWDFNKRMTAANATIERQAQLSGMNARSLWSWGQAARTVGAQPQDITGGITALQTAIMGQGIGAANATGQLVALARLGGVGWNFKTGANIPQLFERVHQLAKQNGYRNLGALRALTAPLMNDAMWSIATNPTFDPGRMQEYVRKAAPPNLDKIIRGSLESQKLLGQKDITAAAMAETGYGVLQNPMDKLVGLMTNLLGDANGILRWTIKAANYIGDIWNFIRHPDIKSPVSKAIESHIAKDLVAHGAKPTVAAKAAAAATPAVAGMVKNSFERSAEEMFAPFALVEKGPALVAAEILKWFYSKPKAQGLGPEPLVSVEIMGPAAAMAAYMRMLSAAQARPHVISTITNQTRTGDIHVHTPTTDPHGHAAAVRKGLSTHPLLGPISQNQVALSTRGAG